MKKYEVTATVSVIVEAESADEAFEKADMRAEDATFDDYSVDEVLDMENDE